MNGFRKCYMKNISDKLGNRIRHYRKKRDWTQEMLALSSGINVSFLGDIERGNKKPSIESLEKLLEALDVTFQEFFAFEADLKIGEEGTALDNLVADLQGRPESEIRMIHDLAKRILLYNDGR